MNAAIASILKDYLITLVWKDKVAGLVKPLVRMDPLKQGNFTTSVRKTFPISCDISYTDCQSNANLYKDLQPDSNLRSIMYFEDRGVRWIKSEGGNDFYRSSLTLVGWVNMNKFKFTGCYISPLLVQSIRGVIPKTPVNSQVNGMTRILSNITGELPKDAGIFSKYTYNEGIIQYLMYPFDYFALTIETDFAMNIACAHLIELSDDPCPTP